jgi:uncharacterized protein (DUF2236 family)
MPHRLSPAAEAELDDIWYYIATESQSIEIADRLVDSITGRFFLIAPPPTSDAAATTICAPVCAVFQWAIMSLSMELKITTC